MLTVAMLSVIMLNVIILSVVILNVIMLNAIMLSVIMLIMLTNNYSSMWSPNEGISAASFCPQVAAWVPDMFCNFYLLKNRKIAKN